MPPDESNPARELPSYAGRCLCGDVSYQARGTPLIVAHCFCRDCQRRTGTARTTGAVFRTEQVTVHGPTASFTSPCESGHEVTRTFCPRCGSALFGRNTRLAETITIGVGTLDDPGAFPPQAAVFVRSRPTWDTTDSALPTFPTQPAWQPETSD